MKLLKELLMTLIVLCVTVSLTSCLSPKQKEKAADGGLDSETSKIISKIENDYNSKYPSHEGLCKVKNYYGIFNGCVPVMFSVPETGALRDDCIAGNVIHYIGSNSIVAWCDGDFLTLTEAYEQGMLTEEHISSIADIHNNKKYLSTVTD